MVPPGEHGQSAQAEAGGATQEGRERDPAPQLDGQENEEESQHHHVDLGIEPRRREAVGRLVEQDAAEGGDQEQHRLGHEQE